MDPHPSTSTLWTGPQQVKLHPIWVRINANYDIVRGKSEYGTPVAIREMLHNSKKHQQTNTTNKKHETTLQTKTTTQKQLQNTNNCIDSI
jgi:hypothetical protein